jgi:aspartate racemase
MERPIAGILGGMGPAATADLYQKIIAATPATRDQEHIHVVIWADPTVPDRTAALLDGGEDPTPWLLRGALRLAAMGASFIAVPCNTVHAFFPRIEPHIAVPFLHMMEETASAVEVGQPLVERIGLLATTGTVRVGLYQEAFARHHIEVAVPDDANQRKVMDAIHRVKGGDTSNEATALVGEAAHYLVGQRAELLITGCTELPLIFTGADASVPVIDPTDILARAVVRRARSLAASIQPAD